MTPESTTPSAAAEIEDRMLTASGTALCAASATLDRWSRTLSAIAILALFLATPRPTSILLAFAVTGAAGLVQAFYAIRLAFDGPIFAAWHQGGNIAAAMESFDAVLVRCGLSGKRPPHRELADRVRGTRRLLHAQFTFFALQVASGLGGTIAMILTGANR